VGTVVVKDGLAASLNYQFSAAQIPFEAVETVFRPIRARTDAKISPAAFGGQHFRGGRMEASAGCEPSSLLRLLKPKQLTLFGPVGREFGSPRRLGLQNL
jgi:hypothetical protein